MTPDWMLLADNNDVLSPALLVYPERVEENLRRMVACVGSPSRLWPHVKTHKLPQIVALQVALGITRCKCATIAEAEMAAGAGAKEIMVAAQMVGPNVARFLALSRRFPHVAFSTIGDDASALAVLGSAAATAGSSIEVLIDLDVGMGRTGVAPGQPALDLFRTVAETRGLRPGGLHAYDGHLRQPELGARCAAAAESIEQVESLRAELARTGFAVPRVVWGGTPTFPIHARRPDVQCSPGTCTLWDAGYAVGVPDLQFLHAAVLLTRVISRPTPSRLCLDLGHKAVASEMPHPRAVFPELPDARTIGHSEEHLVIETARAAEFPVGAPLHAIPWHICPTVALHERAFVVRDHRVREAWPITSRARQISI